MRHPDGFQVLVAVDQLLNTFFCGYADETLSARAWRHKIQGDRSWPVWLLNLMFFWQDNHCKEAYESELNRSHLPPSMRGKNAK